LEALVNEHPEWTGKVAALMINQAGADGGLEGCSESTLLPIGQDQHEVDPLGQEGLPVLWTALGATYNSLAIVDVAGNLVHRIEPVTFATDSEEIVAVVKALLK
jgi:hypothetical protein